MNKGIKAVVEKVVLDGPHGSYAIATTQVFSGSVTFSLERNVWQEHGNPESGEIVFLSELREKRQGWRAKKGRYWNPSDEQTAGKEIIMKSLRVFIEELRSKWFPTGEDIAWKRWVDHERRETRDLIKLLSTDVRDNFKRRAIFLLVVPSADLNPIYWKKDVGRFYFGPDFLKTLTPDLLVYVADIITEFSAILKPLHCDRPKNIVQGGGGITVHMSIPDKYHDALRFYNNCILTLLTMLPVEKGMEFAAIFIM